MKWGVKAHAADTRVEKGGRLCLHLSNETVERVSRVKRVASTKHTNIRVKVKTKHVENL